MGEHSYGHGQFCHYCGIDGDVGDDKPCDESLNKKATDEEIAGFAAQKDLADQISGIAFEVELGMLTLDEAADKVRALKPTAKPG